MSLPTDDARYLELILAPVRECANYRPAFGREAGEGVTLEQFRTFYGGDLLYHWVGLDSELMYAAHKAAGGMTSIYRQLGIGCERLLRGIVMDSLDITEEDARWAYDYDKDDGSTATHTLDIRIDRATLPSENHRARLTAWLDRCSESLGLLPERARDLRGVVMEVRQGYKSADSKRQNADLRFGVRAYNENYLPAVVIVSSQMSAPVIRRYRASQLLVLTGAGGTDIDSTFAFYREVVGYDLAAFFERNSLRLREEFGRVLHALLSPA
ncbi:MAG TPA: hypothetical protein VFX96_04920 [Pyrinomonadaceae bacterium]|nr:hypothetical protein [Pyrinomonadaceae bacterium]